MILNRGDITAEACRVLVTIVINADRKSRCLTNFKIAPNSAISRHPRFPLTQGKQ